MKKETYNKILTECKKISDVEEILDDLQYGVDFEFVDDKIDNACDDDSEDEYVRMRSYTFYLENGKQFYVRFYYGNNTGEIGTYDTKDETVSPIGSAFHGWDEESCLSDIDISRVMEELRKIKS